MGEDLEFKLNDQLIRANDCSPNMTLLEYLRTHHLTGSKEGCAEGDCGSCSVAMVDTDENGNPTYRAINSCLVPLCLLSGREIISVEGIGDSAQLHPVQQKMVACHGSQCGYCTPGFICSLFEGFYRKDLRTPADIDIQLAGNLCRCTGYRSIREAASAAFDERTDPQSDRHAGRLQRDAAELGEVAYAFAGEKFFRPAILTELLRLRKEFPDARLIAGATELGLEITKKFKKFPLLISVEAVPELKEISFAEGVWHIGAAASLTAVGEKLGHDFPALNEMLEVFGSRQIRNRATLGGNLVTASPICDSAPVLLALDAEVVLASVRGERKIPLQKFFLSYRKTALEAGEILKTILIPNGVSPAGLTRRTKWFKVSRRREMDISTVAACLSVDLDPDQIVRRARLAYGGVAAVPARAPLTETALLGQRWSQKTIVSVLPILRNEFTPISDVRGDATYRSGLITSLLQKFFLDETAPETPEFDLDRSEVAPSFPPHESAHKHVTGEAVYADDQTAHETTLEVWPVCSAHARAKILRCDATQARLAPGIKAVLLVDDIPGLNDVGTKHDEPLLAKGEVLYHGQIIALVVGESQEACRNAAAAVAIEYEPLPPTLTIREALESKSFHNEPNFIRRGNCDDALLAASMTIEDEFELGGQEHFYLETHAASVIPGEDGSVSVVSSTQHPSEVQLVISELLHLPVNKVVVQSPRMGGAFGGKETQAATPAALAALAAHATGRPVRVRFNRDQDMMITGHRHPFLARFKAGFSSEGILQAVRVHLLSNGGWAQDLSQAVTDRALFHLDNSYYIPAVEFRGQVAKTNLSSNTAFRGFGGPQGMLVIEEILDRIARRLGLDPETVRERNLYRGQGETNTTHYGQEIEDNRIQTIWQELKRTSDFKERRAEIFKWNKAHAHHKRGLAITPVKFGISFTVTHLNQAGAFVLIYCDGSVQVNHGGTEMGQGLHTNMIAIAAKALGITPEKIRVMVTSTDKVPNTSATAASAGTDLNGAAVKNACEILRARLVPIALELLQAALGRQPETECITFADGIVFDQNQPNVTVSFEQVVKKAYFSRVSLSSTGYYATPGIHWDRVAGRGKPFHYFACGAAVSEVEVDGCTGMHQVRRVDILHDVGDSINAAINRGQIEGGFIQGMGWLTTEELKWDDKGSLLTHSPDTYKIPSIGDTPAVFNVALLANATQKNVVHGTKAVGEPPLMLAISVREAIRDAVAAFGANSGEVSLSSPATGEAIYFAVQRQIKNERPAEILAANASC